MVPHLPHFSEARLCFEFFSSITFHSLDTCTALHDSVTTRRSIHSAHPFSITNLSSFFDPVTIIPQLSTLCLWSEHQLNLCSDGSALLGARHQSTRHIAFALPKRPRHVTGSS